jgi:hypothetical protein
MTIRNRISKKTKLIVRGLPLAAAAVASTFVLTARSQQFLILIVLLWLQVFAVSECYLVDR